MSWPALVFLLPLHALGEPLGATVFVENATAAADLIALLKEELPASTLVETATRADLRAALSSELHLSIIDRAGITLLDRKLKGGRDVAVRVAALLIVEACASGKPTLEVVEEPPAPVLRTRTTTLAPAREWSFGATIGVGFGMWSSRANAQLALQGSAHARFGELELGLLVSSTGRGCACAVRTESLRVEPEATAIAVEARWWWWRPLPALETSVWLAAGYQWESAESRVIGGFAASGPLETKHFDVGIIRVGASLAAELYEPFFFRADFGAHLQRDVRVSLPSLEEYRSAPGREVQRGAVGPWVVLAFGAEL